jgi:nicotinate-nucleotide adenylyltransferase
MLQELYQRDIKIRVIEAGASVPISYKLLSEPGASKIIYSTESPYSKDSFNSRFGDVLRAVSYERVSSVINHDNITTDILNNVYNVIVVSSFQIGDDISQHGWIGIRYKDTTKYFHLVLDHLSRKECFDHIANTVLQLLYFELDVNKLRENRINIVYDNIEETLICLSKNVTLHDDISAVFTSNSIESVETYLREQENINIYKGSFNPVTLSHISIANQSECLFNICINTYEKGSQNIESMKHRIIMLTDLGYSVMVSTKPLFIDSYKYLSYYTDKDINYILGADTFNRIADTYYAENTSGISIDLTHNFPKNFENARFTVYTRKGYDVHILKDHDIVTVKEKEGNDISSTTVREKVMNKEDISELVDIKTKNYILTNNLYGN